MSIYRGRTKATYAEGVTAKNPSDSKESSPPESFEISTVCSMLAFRLETKKRVVLSTLNDDRADIVALTPSITTEKFAPSGDVEPSRVKLVPGRCKPQAHSVLQGAPLKVVVALSPAACEMR